MEGGGRNDTAIIISESFETFQWDFFFFWQTHLLNNFFSNLGKEYSIFFITDVVIKSLTRLKEEKYLKHIF